MSLKRFISAAAAVILTACSVISINAAEPDKATLNVIDISVWSNAINWSLASAEVDGVIARIGYRGSVNRGSLAEDSLFYSHMSGAQQYGVPFGVYFYSLAFNEKEAIEEANWVIDRLKYYGCKPDMPIYIDVEGKTLEENLNSRQRTDIVLAFCKTMKDNGYYAGVYANQYWLSSLLYPKEFENQQYPVWVAQYNTTCTYTGKYGMWQYSNAGKVSGITGSVDMNKCYFDYPSFIKTNRYNGYKGADDTPISNRDYSKRGTYKLSSNASVYSMFSDSSAVLGAIPAKSEVYVDYAIGGFGSVSYSDTIGWIKLSSATKTSDYISDKSGVGYYIVNTNVLNVRTGGSTSYEKVGEVNYGDILFIGGTENGWGWFYGGGAKRWVSLDYVVFYGTVSFDTGISGKYIQPLRIKKGENVKLTSWSTLSSDKEFQGWATSKGGSPQYADGAEITMGGSNITLYAVCGSSEKFSFKAKPRYNENDTVVISDEMMKSTDFISKYLNLPSGCTTSARPSAGSFMGTGSEIDIMNNEKKVATLKIAVSGDCNGDGVCDGIDIADALNMVSGSGSPKSYTELQKKAADVNLDGKIDSTDINMIKNAAFGSADLPQ